MRTRNGHKAGVEAGDGWKLYSDRGRQRALWTLWPSERQRGNVFSLGDHRFRPDVGGTVHWHFALQGRRRKIWIPGPERAGGGGENFGDLPDGAEGKSRTR